VDLGCGNGSLFPVIGLDRVAGVDCHAAGLAHTRAHFPSAALALADVRCLPFADASADAVTAQHLIEHLAEYEKALCEWRRILKPGGMMLVLTPNARFSDPSVFRDESHRHIFDPGALKDALVRAGFEVVDLRTLGLPWFRDYRAIPAGWRLRRSVTRWARSLATLPWWRWRGQTLCCAARRPIA
jgi:ubiquinone/menaquinone biosynthesis C-methylase UbiE